MAALAGPPSWYFDPAGVKASELLGSVFLIIIRDSGINQLFLISKRGKNGH